MRAITTRGYDSKTLEPFLNDLLIFLAPTVKLSSILLWGSHARGQQVAESDIDMILILREDLQCSKSRLIHSFTEFSDVSSCTLAVDLPGIVVKGKGSSGKFDVRLHVLGEVKAAASKARQDRRINYELHTFLQSAKSALILWERAREGRRALTEIERAPGFNVCQKMITEGLNYPSASELARIDRRGERLARALLIAKIMFAAASAFFGISGEFGYFRIKGLLHQLQNLRIPSDVKRVFEKLVDDPFLCAEDVGIVLKTLINYIADSSTNRKVHQAASEALIQAAS